MIHGVIHDGAIVPLDPLPPEWVEGREVVIEAASEASPDDPVRIEAWFAEMQAIGPLQSEPGEREAIEKFMAEADREAKDQVRRSWARFNGDSLSPGHEPPQRDPER